MRRCDVAGLVRELGVALVAGRGGRLEVVRIGTGAAEGGPEAPEDRHNTLKLNEFTGNPPDGDEPKPFGRGGARRISSAGGRVNRH